jgi:HlyD family secretion protein
MTAQTIFLVATDLSQVQVEASVPEADIGSVREGQPVAFTVDAYDREFTGSVAQVRMASASVQNVVTYPVIIKAANPEGRLFPGMTASLSCEISRADNALKIPNAALRFQPESAARTNAQARVPGKARKAQRTVWVKGPGGLASIDVEAAVTDGSYTALERGALVEGQEIITGILEAGAAAETVNPFVPRMPRRGGH